MLCRRQIDCGRFCGCLVRLPSISCWAPRMHCILMKIYDAAIPSESVSVASLAGVLVSTPLYTYPFYFPLTDLARVPVFISPIGHGQRHCKCWHLRVSGFALWLQHANIPQSAKRKWRKKQRKFGKSTENVSLNLCLLSTEINLTFVRKLLWKVQSCQCWHISYFIAIKYWKQLDLDTKISLIKLENLRKNFQLQIRIFKYDFA